MKVLNLLSAGGVGGIEQLCSNIAKYAKYDNTFCFLFEEGLIFEEMRKNGYDVVSLAGYSKNKYSYRRWKKLCELVDRTDIVVTHHCTIALHSYYVALCRHCKNKKFVMTIHSCFEPEQNYNYGSWIKNKIAKLAIEFALKESDKVLFVSEAGRKSYIENFKIDNLKTDVVYNGVEIPDPFCNENIEKQSNYTQITYIGRIEKIKGIELLIYAVARLYKFDQNFKVWIIGDGSYRTELEYLVQKLKLNEVIYFLGTKRNIADYLRRTDIFVYPSTCQEVFGISIVEAMSYGIPCIANNVGGIPEIIINGLNGYITCAPNEEELFRCIYSFMQLETSDMVRIKKNCIETAKRFSIQNTMNMLERVFKGLIDCD